MADEIVLHVTEANYEDTVVKCDKPVLLAIGAPWCIDCKRIEPMFMEYAQKYHDKIQFAHCDFDTEAGAQRQVPRPPHPDIAFDPQRRNPGYFG